MKPRHLAVVSGLALTLVAGAATVSTPAFAAGDSAALQGDAHDTDAATAADGALVGDEATGNDSEQLPEPADYDIADFYEEAPSISVLSTLSSTSSSLASVTVSSEMKYFTKYESHSNYNQGLSSGDGYNALGYYQFDRRYSLIPFLTAVYNTNTSKYSMLKTVINRGSEIKSATSLYDSSAKSLTSLGKLVQNAWTAAYNADPAEFSAFQDAYAYNSYYVPTEQWLKNTLGIDISGRADCVKGMVWGLSNLWGTGGVRNILRGANLSNSMTDLEFVTALAKQMTDNISKYSSQTQYYKGWANRYKNELNDCKAYLALHESEDEADDEANDNTSSDSNTSGNAQDNQGGAGSAENTTDSDEESEDEEPEADSNADSGTDDVKDETASDSTDGDKDDSTQQNTDEPTQDAGEEDNGETGSEPLNGEEGTSSEGAESTDNESSQTESEPEEEPSPETDGDNDTDAKVEDESHESSETEKKSEETSEKQSQTAAKSESDQTSKATTDEQGSKKQAADDASKTSVEENGESAKKSGTMPQTSDLIMFTGFAGASVATFGATFVAAGKAGLRKRKNKGADN